MATAKSFPLVRGRTLRVTRLDGCCRPLGGPDSQIVTEGFVSVALTANVTEPEEITVVNANGQTCVRDPGCPEFNGYGVELTFCDVNPCLFSIITGQPSVVNAAGDVVGFRMNSDISVCDLGFSLEVWMGVPGVACTAEGGANGYLLLPCLRGGVIGDFTIENAAINFTVTGSSTKEGNGWGRGPFNVVLDENGDPGLLPDPLDPNDHLYVVFTEVQPPAPTDGCVELELPGALDVAAAISGSEVTLSWTQSSEVNCQGVATNINWGDGSQENVPSGTMTAVHYYTNPGTFQVTVAPVAPSCAATFVPVTVATVSPPSTGANAGTPGDWTPADSLPPQNVAALSAGTPNAVVPSPTAAWTTGQFVQTRTSGTAGQAYWDGDSWNAGVAP